MPPGNKKNYQSRWRNKFYLGLTLIIMIFFVINFARAWLQNFRVNQEINNLKQEITGLEQENSKYGELIKFLNSTAYIEERARVDLGLKKAGEKVVLIPTSQEQLPSPAAAGAVGTESNPQKWLRTFFK